MSKSKPGQSVWKHLNRTGRKAITISRSALVQTKQLRPESPLPLILEPAVEGVDLCAWAENNLGFIETNLLRAGGLLFRNFGVGMTEIFEQFVETTCGELLEYSYRSTPRSHVSGRIYTSTEYPSDQTIPLHNEMAYSTSWPMRICFFCVEPAEHGGENPIADSRSVFESIDPEIRERFTKKRVKYVRNYGGNLDLSWQNVFQTTNRESMEDFCRKASIEFEWGAQGGLRTSQTCQAVATHPQTKEALWFNQAHLFHVSSLPEETRAALLNNVGENSLPRNAYYGDGSPIEAAVIEQIKQAYAQHTVLIRLQRGDILMLDNMLVAHGRAPFTGPRKILVGMAQPHCQPESQL